jgi:hypothetical protein
MPEAAESALEVATTTLARFKGILVGVVVNKSSAVAICAVHPVESAGKVCVLETANWHAPVDQGKRDPFPNDRFATAFEGNTQISGLRARHAGADES